MAEAAGYKVQAYDIAYGAERAKKRGRRSSMDMNSNAGMVPPSSKHRISSHQLPIRIYFINHSIINITKWKYSMQSERSLFILAVKHTANHPKVE